MRVKKKSSKTIAVSGKGGEIVLYRTKDGRTNLEIKLTRNTMWMDAHQMAKLFGRDRSVIVRHISNIYATRELQRSATCAKNAQVAADGKLRQMDLYNLDMIISVGYRVNSKRGTEFRIWAKPSQYQQHRQREAAQCKGELQLAHTLHRTTNSYHAWKEARLL